jgi:hypothetical protein
VRGAGDESGRTKGRAKEWAPPWPRSSKSKQEAAWETHVFPSALVED